MGLPATFHCLGSRSFIVFRSGGVSLAAAGATFPYVVERFDAACVITPLDAVSSPTGTFHSSAAACRSIVRPAAPLSSKYFGEVRIPRLPPVHISPQARLLEWFWPAVIGSTVTFFQS